MGSQVDIMDNHPRAGWDKAFAAMGDRGDDLLFDETVRGEWDETEWAWR